MRKTFLVRLTAEQVTELTEVIKKQAGSHEMIRRANILLAANVDGLNWVWSIFNSPPEGHASDLEDGAVPVPL